jgi:hypothetical protein
MHNMQIVIGDRKLGGSWECRELCGQGVRWTESPIDRLDRVFSRGVDRITRSYV